MKRKTNESRYPMTQTAGIHKTQLPNAIVFREVEAWLADNHPVTLKAVGNSMWPFITGGRDEVVIQPYSAKQSLECGQIVLARLSEGCYVLHRILRIDSDQITLLGDGHWRQREYCSSASIIGRVSIIRRNGHSINCFHPAERFRTRLWMNLLPIRRYLLFLGRRILQPHTTTSKTIVL